MRSVTADAHPDGAFEGAGVFDGFFVGFFGFLGDALEVGELFAVGDGLKDLGVGAGV